MENKKKFPKWVKRILWVCGSIIVLVLLIAIFGPDPNTTSPTNSLPKYTITESDQWNKGATFKVKVDSVLSEKNAIEIAKKIKLDSVSENKEVTVWFYRGIDFSSGATQTVNFAKGDSIANYSISSVSNKEVDNSKNLTLDSLQGKEVIAADLIPNAGAKEVIYKLKNGRYVQTVLFNDGGYAPFVNLEPDPNNTTDLYNFRIVSGIDSGMTVKVDRYQKIIEFREPDGDLAFRRKLLD